MNMEAFLAKLKELKLKMAELENAEDALPAAEKDAAEAAEGESPAVDKLDAKVDALDLGKESAEPEMSDDDLMSAFGKKKKDAPKPGMKIAFGGKAKGKPLFGKHK